MREAIITEGLTKVFSSYGKGSKRRVVAVDHVDLRISRGELFGLLGPNGAGKTTLVKLLCTLLIPTEGDAWVGGYHTVKEDKKVRKLVGVVLGGERALYWRLTGWENMWFFSQLYGIPEKDARRRIKELLSFVGLEERAHDRVENYSKGMKQRLHIARGLVHDPEILLLDEPTIGLDPVGAKEVRALVKDLTRKAKKTVLLTTHYMYEADELSDRVAIIDRGRIIALGPSNDLKAMLERKNIVSLVVRKVPVGIEEDLCSLEGVKKVAKLWYNPERDEASFKIISSDAEELTSYIANIVSRKEGKVISLSVERPSLEDVFIELTGRSIASGTPTE